MNPLELFALIAGGYSVVVSLVIWQVFHARRDDPYFNCERFRRVGCENFGTPACVFPDCPIKELD